MDNLSWTITGVLDVIAPRVKKVLAVVA